MTAARRYALLAAPALVGLAALATLRLARPPEVHAYSNCVESDFMKGGPHRAINELALEHFFKTLPGGDVRAPFVDTSDTLPVRGPMVVGRSPYDPRLVEEKRGATWKEWVIQGGFSADEPELYNSFRHFYDPLSLNPNPRYPLSSQGVPYLTDHLEQTNTYLKPSLLTCLKNPKLGAAAWTANIAARWYFDVQVDARAWAINGSKGQGFWENEYCWNKGVEYFRAAFTGQENGKPLDGTERDERFAQAWRALGETMHLLADMCCPPHVRNDSHPGVSLGAMMYDAIGISPGAESHDPNVGILRNDPYELFCQEELIRKCGKESAPDSVETTLRSTDSPMDLFHNVAAFTNRNFFSADTVPFPVPGSAELQMANGCKPYPLPKLGKPDKDGYYVGKTEFWERDVKLCHKSWLTKAGWAGELHAGRITYPCVKEQAAILIPLAKSALARLVDWFLPKLELTVEGYEPTAKTLTLRVKHTPYGAFPKELLYADTHPICLVRLDSYTRNSSLYTTSANEGKLTLDLSRLPVESETKAIVELLLGGLRLRSPEIRLDAANKPKITIKPIPPTQVGDEVYIEAQVENGPDNAEYEWDYGDGQKERTRYSSVRHRYMDIPTGPVRVRLYGGKLKWDKVLAEAQAAVPVYHPPAIKAPAYVVAGTPFTASFYVPPGYPHKIAKYDLFGPRISPSKGEATDGSSVQMCVPPEQAFPSERNLKNGVTTQLSVRYYDAAGKGLGGTSLSIPVQLVKLDGGNLPAGWQGGPNPNGFHAAKRVANENWESASALIDVKWQTRGSKPPQSPDKDGAIVRVGDFSGPAKKIPLKFTRGSWGGGYVGCKAIESVSGTAGKDGVELEVQYYGVANGYWDDRNKAWVEKTASALYNEAQAIAQSLKLVPVGNPPPPLGPRATR